MSAKVTLAALKQLATKYGALVEDDSTPPWKTYQVIAPPGRRWRDGGVHALKLEWEPGQYPGWKKWREEEIGGAMQRIKEGLDVCPADCDCLLEE